MLSLKALNLVIKLLDVVLKLFGLHRPLCLLDGEVMSKSCLAQLYFFALFLDFRNLYFVILVNFFELLFMLSCNCFLSLFEHAEFLSEVKLNLVLLLLSILIGSFILISLMSQYLI